MNSMNSTFYQSFSQKLPVGDRGASSDVDRTHVSGSSANSTPPRVGLRVQAELWLQLGQSVLNTGGLRQYLESCFLFKWDSRKVLRNEADVDRASTLQLMPPVDEALGESHQTPITSLCQFQRDSARPDLVYEAEIARSRKPFAIVDYKRAGTISHQEFSVFLAGGDRAQQTGRFSATLRPQQKAAKLMMIATNYATTFRTPYVAIFDWDYLLLCVMEHAEAVEGGNGSDGGDWCRVTIIHDRAHMRLALLGFLEAAYRDVIEKKPYLPRYTPPNTTEQRRQPSERIAQNPKPYYGPQPGDNDGGNNQYTHTAQLGNIHEVSLASKYGKATSASKYGKEKAYASATGDFGMGRLTLGSSRRDETPRSSKTRDQQVADYYKAQTMENERRYQATRPANPVASSQRTEYDPRYNDPRYRR